MFIYLTINLLFFIALIFMALYILLTFTEFLHDYLIPRLIREELDSREQNQEELQELIDECRDLLPDLIEEEATIKELIEEWKAHLREQHQFVQSAARDMTRMNLIKERKAHLRNQEQFVQSAAKFMT